MVLENPELDNNQERAEGIGGIQAVCLQVLKEEDLLVPMVLHMAPYAEETGDFDLYNHDDRRSLEVVVPAGGAENSWLDVSLRVDMALAPVVFPSS